MGEILQQPRMVTGILIGLTVAVALLLCAVCWLFLETRRLRSRQNTLFGDGEAQSAENILQRHSEEIESLDKEIQQLFEISNRLHRLAHKSVHRVGFIRFNPFKDVGGNQSFSLALLDGRNSGVVVSSLHTREGSRVYAKPIEGGQSPIPLTEEEQKAIRLSQSPDTGAQEKA